MTNGVCYPPRDVRSEKYFNNPIMPQQTKPTRKAGENAAAYATRVKQWEKANTPVATEKNDTDSKEFRGIVVSVDPTIKTKTNGNEYITCKVELEGMNHPKTGKPIVVAAQRTTKKVVDIDGNPLDEPVESSMVEEGQTVTLYGRKVVNEESGEEVAYFDVSTGSTDNSDADVLAELF